MSSRSKGKTYELEIAKELQEIFPGCHRNWMAQSAIGGVDLAGTGCFDFEIKGGNYANIAKIRGWLKQVEEEGKDENFKVVVVRPIREERYVVMPFKDFKEILNLMKKEGLI